MEMVEKSTKIAEKNPVIAQNIRTKRKKRNRRGIFLESRKRRLERKRAKIITCKNHTKEFKKPEVRYSTITHIHVKIPVIQRNL